MTPAERDEVRRRASDRLADHSMATVTSDERCACDRCDDDRAVLRYVPPGDAAEVRALRADKAALLKHIDYNPSLRIRECEALRAKLAEAKRLGMEACAVASAIAGDRIACDAAGIAAIAAALEAL